MRSQGRHELLFAHLFFSGGEVTEEIMNLARQHAEDGRPANLRMLGLALYRIGKDEQALSLLKKAATTRLSPDGKITSLLCLALVQHRMGDLEEARYTIRQARKVQDNSPDRSRSTHRMPWGVIPSLWREVRTAMEAADIEEPIPELPLAFEEWVARSAPTDAVE